MDNDNDDDDYDDDDRAGELLNGDAGLGLHEDAAAALGIHLDDDDYDDDDGDGDDAADDADDDNIYYDDDDGDDGEEEDNGMDYDDVLSGVPTTFPISRYMIMMMTMMTMTTMMAMMTMMMTTTMMIFEDVKKHFKNQFTNTHIVIFVEKLFFSNFILGVGCLKFLYGLF